MTPRARLRDAARRLHSWRGLLYALIVGLTMPPTFVRPAGGWASLALVLGPAHPAAGFAAPVSLLAQALLPWTSLLPFVLVRRGALAGVALLAVGVQAASSRGPGLLVVAALAVAVGGMLADLDRERGPLALLAAGVLGLGGLVARGQPLAAWWLPAAAMPSLLASPEWLRRGRLRVGRGFVLLAAGALGSVFLRAHS